MNHGQSTKSKYDALEAGSGKKTSDIKQLVYPSNLLDSNSGNGQFLLLNFNTIVGTSFRSKATRVENPEVVSGYDQPVINDGNSGSIRRHMRVRHKRSPESIAIMMPETVSTNYGSNWENIELGSAGQMLRTATNLDNLKLSDVKNYALEQMKGATTGLIQAITPINAADAAELFTGTIANPYVEVLFKGVMNREIPLTFTFTPKNNEESLVVREIIRRLKFHMHPEFKYRQSESSYLLNPSTVDLTWMRIDQNAEAVRNAWLWRVSTCAITNVAEDVSGDDGYSVHDDDAPTVIKLDVTLTELEPMHKGRFNDEEDSF
mgnify:CR=1 FL=1